MISEMFKLLSKDDDERVVNITDAKSSVGIQCRRKGTLVRNSSCTNWLPLATLEFHHSKGIWINPESSEELAIYFVGV